MRARARACVRVCARASVCVCDRDRQTDRETERDTERDTQRDTERDRETKNFISRTGALNGRKRLGREPEWGGGGGLGVWGDGGR